MTDVRDDAAAMAAYAARYGLDREEAEADWRFLSEEEHAHWRGVAADRLALARVRGLAEAWGKLAPPGDWGEGLASTAVADAGRLILAVLDGHDPVPCDCVADHPGDCPGVCCQDARREAEAQMNDDSGTEPATDERRS